ncbi:hypothetical protein Fmac_019361 [Flemingia macrophylla]|uniref:non-specific serine/threonine protein kinase n=1 Tax=Flemingia macrophylla TaxID=520843 RepID=A0ABD1M7Q4_9FABA
MFKNNSKVNMRSGVLFSLVLSWVLCSQLCSARDTLNHGESITNYEGNLSLVSSNLTFELGFFNFSNSREKRYLGIWYYGLDSKIVVWVANRDKPVLDSSGVFRISEKGNLVVESTSGTHWSSPPESSSSAHRTVILQASGNLVLRDGDGKVLWQSFLHPTDTFLPGMKMDHNLTLTSWKGAADPAPGDFTFKMDPNHNLVVQKQSQRYWTVDDQRVTTLLNVTSDNSSSNITLGKLFGVPIHSNSRLVMNYSGEIQYLMLDKEEKVWYMPWSMLADKCDIYNYCGSFGICNKNNLNLNLDPCKCLPGFATAQVHIQGQYPGCVRKSTSCIDGDFAFVNLTNIKVGEPDYRLDTETEADCQASCLNITAKCPHSQCQAYSYSNTSYYYNRAPLTCKIWTRNLSTLLPGNYDRGVRLSILVKRSDIEPTVKTCEPCGIYVIPYPLSTGPNCGDPMYHNFCCDKSTGNVSFLMPEGVSYPVTSIDEDTREFVIVTNDPFSFSSENRIATPDFPFDVITDPFSNNGVIKIQWQPAPEPPCSRLIDCKDWLHSSCRAASEGRNRCLCDSNYKWNITTMKCTQEETSGNRSLAFILTATLTGLAILAGLTAFVVVRKKKTAHKLDQASTRIQESLCESERHVKGLIGLASLEEKAIEGIEVPCFTFASILAATDNFSDSNRLGRGGYGPVYKGKFPGGQYVAVKRLSSISTQGLHEFKNEVILIAKLQHRNLVRLRGYCVKGDEKILLYEYMSNKSLDSFIFDRTRTFLLDWPMRLEIIVGIARGMLYLHQDSRLRVIHRDMKTSNVLLDEEMNPKISDFGLAKIFGGKEIAASTERVVGTYGYMAPEYALDGLFSIKSDVFSFGVVLLEILSGKRNTGFYQSKHVSSLLGYAWKLWTENKLLDLMDPSLGETCNDKQFIKCALIGLLCIQDEPADRPTMSNVLSMLEVEIASMPIPTKPTFFVNKRLSGPASSSSKSETIQDFDSSYQEGR